MATNTEVPLSNSPEESKTESKIDINMTFSKDYDSVLTILRRAIVFKMKSKKKQQQKQQHRISKSKSKSKSLNVLSSESKIEEEFEEETTAEQSINNEFKNLNESIISVKSNKSDKLSVIDYSQNESIDNLSEDSINEQPNEKLFREYDEWNWTDDDIIIKDINKNMNKFRSILKLQLIYYKLSKGPIYPNTKLSWYKLQFNNEKNKILGRNGHTSKFIDNKLIIYGGYCKEILSDHIFIMDNINDNLNNLNMNKINVIPISSMENMYKTFRVGHKCVKFEHNNCLYIYGGWNEKNYINFGLLFNIKSLKLILEQTKDKILPPERKDHTIVKMGNNLILFGGISNDYCQNDLWILTSNWKWQKLKINNNKK